MIIAAKAHDATPYAEQYELLRVQADSTASERATARGIGLALLLRGGMPEWLKAVKAVLCTTPAPEPAASSHTTTTLSAAQRRDITATLTSLILSTRHPADLASNGGCRP